MQRGSAADVMRSPCITLAVVGDVHSQWTADDEAALASLGADVAVFVGDFGEENVQLVQRVADLPHPKAVILGNHDAWFSLTPSGRKRFAKAMLSSSSLAMRQQFSEGGSSTAIAAQLAALGDDHIGFGSKRFPSLGLTLLGGRPFSKGGKQWSDIKDFYAEHYGIGSSQDSAMRLLDVALAAQQGDCKVLVAHSGPKGLGGRRYSMCGVDWTEPEADFGDPDLQEALDMMHSQGLHLPLVLFGHMHSQLSGGGLRNMAEVDAGRGTVYLNAAVVPRIRSLPLPAATGGNSSGGSGPDSPAGDAAGSSGSAEKLNGHHFLVVELRQHVVTAARDVWVGVQRYPAPQPAAGSSVTGQQPAVGAVCTVLRHQELLRTAFPPEAGGSAVAAAAAGAANPAAEAAAETAAAEAAAAADAAADESGASYVCSVWRANSQEWEPVVMRLPALHQAAVM